ncbi:hypothetical protein C8R47DRAFT_1329469 [Mycena vitilis]|nr:hypothetical protein C8R47DRAFT_1329469 [Mycena vitilis]
MSESFITTIFGAVSVLLFALAVATSNYVTLPLPHTAYWPLRLSYTTFILNLCLFALIAGVFQDQAIATTPENLTLFALTTGGGVVLSEKEGRSGVFFDEEKDLE